MRYQPSNPTRNDRHKSDCDHSEHKNRFAPGCTSPHIECISKSRFSRAREIFVVRVQQLCTTLEADLPFRGRNRRLVAGQDGTVEEASKRTTGYIPHCRAISRKE